MNEIVQPTTIIRSTRLSDHLGVNITLASETFQHTGSFKFRAAYHLASNVPQRHIIAASSGNFGQALAYSCALLSKTCTVVMPSTSARVKIDAVRNYGARIELIDTRMTSRAEKVAELARSFPMAFIASAYDDPLIIEGNSSLGEELAALDQKFDYIIVPIGGGGLSSGIIKGIQRSHRQISVIGAEPSIANDAAQSLREARIVSLPGEPATIADGARTVSLGEHNWAILRDGLVGIVEVPEVEIVEAVRVLYQFANLKAEPTGSLAIAALLTEPLRFRYKQVCCVISGGNVDARV